MRNCTPLEQQVARHYRIPDARNWRWWWRAQNVLNSPERQKLDAYVTWLRRQYASEIEANRRRATLRIV